VDSVGYWIIVILIVLGGALVLIAAASVADDVEPSTRPGALKPARKRTAVPRRSTITPQAGVSVAVLIPRMWLQGEQTRVAVDVPGTVTSTKLLGGSTLSDVASAIDASSNELKDSVVVIIIGTDDFLAGNSIENVLDHLDRLMDRLTELPAMAVVGSMPNIGPELADRVNGIPEVSISATIADWNQAIAGLVQSYSAEFVDLDAVPVHLLELDSNAQGPALSAIPNVGELISGIGPAIGRAVDRVQSLRCVS
jgi:hypothetical protein